MTPKCLLLMSISLSGGGIFPGINVRKSEKNMVSSFYTKFNKTLFIYFFAFISVFDTIFHLATRSAHMALGARLTLRRPSQNRLKLGVRREGTVSNHLLESRRLPRTDGWDPASICSRARRGGILLSSHCMLPLGKLGFIKVLGLYIFCEKLAKQLRNKWATRKVLVKRLLESF